MKRIANFWSWMCNAVFLLSLTWFPSAFRKKIFILRFILARNGIRSPRLWFVYTSRLRFTAVLRNLVTTVKYIYTDIAWVNSSFRSSSLCFYSGKILIDQSTIFTSLKINCCLFTCRHPSNSNYHLTSFFYLEVFSRCKACAFCMFFSRIVGGRGVRRNHLILHKLLSFTVLRQSV